ncbi:MAG: hypothetical protein JW821_13360, partial [Deltaproteobacteria bacterium]|nr:hypothetical protein [Deltaproteobacteria bacterium]
MISAETEKLLSNLENIETGLSRVYGHLSRKEHFSSPVKKFWTTLMEEELVHASVFRELLKKSREEASFQVEAKTDRTRLEAFVEKVNDLLKKVKKEDLSESEAYTIGALIEAELDEAHFVGTMTV